MNYYSKRRATLASHLKDGDLVVIFAGGSVRNSADSSFVYEANRNYHYLTGMSEEDGILVMYRFNGCVREVLYIRDINPDLEKWVGRFIKPQKAREISGIDEVLFVSRFEKDLDLYFNRFGVSSILLDLDRVNVKHRPFEAELFAKKIQDLYLGIKIVNIHSVICQLRTIKDELEIKLIKEACKLTGDAIRFAVKNMRAGMFEYQVMAHYLYHLNMNGATEMFDTIMASGVNGPILHYVSNDQVINDGDLILFDLGAKKNEYGADISRTYPVNGKFSDRQREIYEIVLGCQDEVTKHVVPGVTFGELNNIAIKYFQKELKRIGLIDKDEDVNKYYYHSIGHFLGLDTHDVGQLNGMELVPGMVITNEPGLYIQEENIGIRIETDLLVVDDGCIDLGEGIEKTVADIEALMSNN